MSRLVLTRRRAAAAAAMLATGTTVLLPLTPANADAPASQTFTYTGAPQQFTVPDHVGVLHVTAIGSAGGHAGLAPSYARPGRGADVDADVPVGPTRSVHAGDNLVVTVGGVGGDGGAPGYNGGGTSQYRYEGSPTYELSWTGGGGGGASDVRLPAGALTDRIVVAAGGGGAGYIMADGGDAGSPGSDPYGYGAGQAGTDTAGGLGGTPGNADANGSFGQGGNGATLPAYDSEHPEEDAGGAGGGGWYGGGGGGVPADGRNNEAAGGGGGSSHVYSEGTLISQAVTDDPASVTISWTVDTQAPVIAATADITTTATSSSGATAAFTTPGATDNLDGTDPVSCDHQSGDLFPVGVTTVTCTATDAAQNTATSTFHVTVTPQPTPPTAPNKADLKVITTGPTTINRGATATWTITVANTGPATATKVDTVAVTSGLNTVTASANPKQGSMRLGRTTLTGLHWTADTLAPGKSITYTVAGTAANTGKARLTAATLSTVPDPNLLNNLAVSSAIVH